MQISIHVEGIRKAQQKLKLTAEKLRDMRQFWTSVGMYVQRQTIRERFDKEQTPDGQKWKPLSPATIKHRKKHHKKGNMKILQDTGELRRSVAYEADDKSVRIGSKLKYARTHQFGRGNIPARPFLGVNDPEKLHITSMFRQYVKRNILGST
ncbi:MAG: phage virion morphogenesis protein [Synergistaceae bacterium]|nr:phage virion morphogenesis protein [Synergistaceae bacterium]MBQ6114674.1 phage virion morphogenesis protein [Synergistaceae bacterium]